MKPPAQKALPHVEGDNLTEGYEFGNFDDTVAGDVRDPYPELARARREHPVQRLESSVIPHDEAHPVFFVYRYDDMEEFIGKEVEAVKKAIEASDWDAFEDAFKAMVDAANAYHDFYDKTFLQWKVPSEPPPDLDITPRR